MNIFFCLSVECSEGEFQCGPRECVSSLVVCDGRNDCFNGADERQNCPGVCLSIVFV